MPLGKDVIKDILNRIPEDSIFKPQSPPKSSTTRALTNDILALLNSNRLKKAVKVLFASSTCFPSFLYARLFQHCASKFAIVEARKLEFHLVSFHTVAPAFLLNRAIETYGKCGSLDDARGLFDEMPLKDGGSWNAMITAYAQNGRSENALRVFKEMSRLGESANEITFAGVLGSCAAILDLSLAQQIHGLVVKYGFSGNVVLGTSVVDIYGKCWLMDDARRMFDEIENPNAVSWNVIVRRYLEVGDDREAVIMFSKMIERSVRPLTFTFSTALIACSNVSALREGKEIHGIAVRLGFLKTAVVLDSLINMYAKCGSLVNARLIFDQHRSKDVVTWTKIVSAYATYGKLEEARELFNAMPERNVVSWNAMLVGYTRFLQWEEALEFICWMRTLTTDYDHVTLGLILNVCAGLTDIILGKQVHGFAYRHGFHSNIVVANAVLAMYGKCGNVKSSKIWFSEMGPLRDRVSWNALISTHACHFLSEEALPMFAEMLHETTPSESTFSTLLAACANINALDQGKQTHCYMLRNGYNLDVFIRGALVDMYSKCRFLDYAIKVFKESASTDLILWNSMFLGCAHNGKGNVVLALFELMLEEGIKPDHVTFQGILLACICEGFVDMGRQYFDSMSTEYCIIPRLEHYECIIELYCKYGFMEELEDFVHKMPFEATEPMVTRIFDACREYRHSKLGGWAAQRLNEFRPVTPISVLRSS